MFAETHSPLQHKPCAKPRWLEYGPECASIRKVISHLSMILLFLYQIKSLYF